MVFNWPCNYLLQSQQGLNYLDVRLLSNDAGYIIKVHMTATSLLMKKGQFECVYFRIQTSSLKVETVF